MMDDFLKGLAVALVYGLFKDDLRFYLLKTPYALVTRLVRRLPEQLREPFLQEWFAELDANVTIIWRFWFVGGLYLHFEDIKAALAREGLTEVNND